MNCPIDGEAYDLGAFMLTLTTKALYLGSST